MGLDLRTPPNDARAFARWAAQAAPGRHTRFDDANIPATKDEFLRSLVRSLGAAEYVNLNFSGHGHRLRDGDWGFPLPGVPAPLADHCLDRYKWSEITSVDFTKQPKPANPDEDCARLRDYLVTGADLRAALKGKKVFAVLDACHAGAMRFDDGAALVAQTQDQTATDGRGSDLNGLLTKTVKQMSEGCDVARAIGYVARENQQMALVQSSPQPWLGCVKLGEVNESVRRTCQACARLKGKTPSGPVSCLARPPARAGEDPGAFTFPGTPPPPTDEGVE